MSTSDVTTIGEVLDGALLNLGGRDPATPVSEGVPTHSDLSAMPGLPVPGERGATDGAIKRVPQPTPASLGRLSSGLWVPVGRREAGGLLDSPRLLRLYFRLRDETSRARWKYADDVRSGTLYFRGYAFEWIEPHTFVFELTTLARSLGLSENELADDLRSLFASGHLDALHFGIESAWDAVTSAQGFGVPVSRLIGVYEPYDCENWAPCAVYMRPLAGSFVRMPKEAGEVKAEMLRLLVWLYLHATFRRRSLSYHGRTYRLVAGELVISFAELERELGVPQRQVGRWASYALRDGLGQVRFVL